MCECIDDVGPLEPAFGVGVDKGHDFVGHHQNLSNCPWPDDIISQSSKQAQPLRADNVVHEDEVLLWEDTEVLGVIPLPHAFHVCW